MGFGYLLLGYLVTYVIYLTASAFGIGSLALLIGTALMFWGLRGLCRFSGSFELAKWLTLPLFAIGLCCLWQDVAKAWLSWEGQAADVMMTVITWTSFAITLLFHIAMLYAIRVLSLEVELGKLAAHAMYNTIAVGIWGVLFLLCNMPILGDSLLPYLNISVWLFYWVYVISDVILLLRCAKNICAEGDEEVPMRPSRFAWVNRMRDSYTQTMDKLKANSRADGDAFMRNQLEKKQQKNSKNQTNKKHKKKKKK